MEPKHDTASSPKGRCYIIGQSFTPKEKTMAVYPALLCSCVVSVLALCHVRPQPIDSFKTITREQANTINARIQDYKDKLPIFHILDSSELLPELQADKPIEGLGSMVETLNTFQQVLRSLPKGPMSKLYNDVSTLQEFLEDRMGSLQCKRRKTSSENLEAYLKTHSTYHMTVSQVTLGRLQKYLQRLIQNLDQLKTC